MNNIIETAIGEARKAAVRGNGHVGAHELRLRWLLGRVVKDLPTEEGYLAVTPDAGVVVDAARDATAVAIAPPGAQNPEALKGAVDQYHAKHPGCQFMEGDFFKIIATSNPFPKPIGLYFYGGPRFPSNLRAAVSRSRPFLAPQAIVVLDNWAVPSVRQGTWEGIAALKPEQLAFYELPPNTPDGPEGFGNGCAVFHVTI